MGGVIAAKKPARKTEGKRKIDKNIFDRIYKINRKALSV